MTTTRMRKRTMMGTMRKRTMRKKMPERTMIGRAYGKKTTKRMSKRTVMRMRKRHGGPVMARGTRTNASPSSPANAGASAVSTCGESPTAADTQP